MQRYGKSWSSHQIVLGTLPNQLNHNRYGFVVSKRIGKATTRNQVKRRLRAAVNLPTANHDSGHDIVIIARPPAASASYQTLQQSLIVLAKRAGIEWQLPS